MSGQGSAAVGALTSCVLCGGPLLASPTTPLLCMRGARVCLTVGPPAPRSRLSISDMGPCGWQAECTSEDISDMLAQVRGPGASAARLARELAAQRKPGCMLWRWGGARECVFEHAGPATLW